MPKEHRIRNTRHEPSVMLGKRDFAVQGNAVEHITIGGAMMATGTEILQSFSAPMNHHPVSRKKEKMQSKRGAFLQRLESSKVAHSKSHQRRVKRKAREQIASGLDEIQAAIDALDDGNAGLAAKSTEGYTNDTSPKPKPKAEMIAEGKKTPLTGAQRKRALQLEQTIRTHAQNTLVKRKIPE